MAQGTESLGCHFALSRNRPPKEKEYDEKFYREHGFYEQSHDFFDIWFDNDVSDVQISFPLLKAVDNASELI
ncbi:hypothetical protein FHB94_23875 [Citrobacter freundii]|uniref:hypothetical protein n=1 Tax=Citrobacter freundii TaxID=546 RepID=UPI001C70A057|nr:hypothetical protein [Citrobacter freundii]MBW9593776.1 hypothetical protein [Citrobacter freundii]